MYCHSRLAADFNWEELFSFFFFKTDTEGICKTARKFIIRKLFRKLVVFVEKNMLIANVFIIVAFK